MRGLAASASSLPTLTTRDWARHSGSTSERNGRSLASPRSKATVALRASGLTALSVITTTGTPRRGPKSEDDLATDFARTVDETLVRLKRFVETDANHHPKLYVWLPGLAVCALAASAALPVGWLSERYESKADGYERLPFELLNNPQA